MRARVRHVSVVSVEHEARGREERVCATSRELPCVRLGVFPQFHWRRADRSVAIHRAVGCERHSSARRAAALDRKPRDARDLSCTDELLLAVGISPAARVARRTRARLLPPLAQPPLPATRQKLSHDLT